MAFLKGRTDLPRSDDEFSLDTEEEEWFQDEIDKYRAELNEGRAEGTHSKGAILDALQEKRKRLYKIVAAERQNENKWSQREKEDQQKIKTKFNAECRLKYAEFYGSDTGEESASAGCRSPAKKKHAARKKNSFPSHLRDHRLAADGARHSDVQRPSKPFDVDASERTQGSSALPYPPAILVDGNNSNAFSSITSSESSNFPAKEKENRVINLEGGDEGEASYDPTKDDEDFPNRLSLMVKSKLNTNYHKDNHDSYDKPFFKNIMDKLIEKKPLLLKKASLVDKEEKYEGRLTLQKLLRDAIPNSVAKNISKLAMSEHFVAIWKVLRLVIGHDCVKLERTLTNAIDDYLGLMEQTVAKCEAALEEDLNKDVNGKSLKMPRGEEARGYLEDGALKPPKKYSTCPKCGYDRVHEPPCNVEKRKSNRKVDQTWVAQNAHCERFKNGEESEPLRDKKGRAIYKVPAPKHEEELLVCKMYLRNHSNSVGGFQCPNCNDRTCPECKCKCRFVCSKR